MKKRNRVWEKKCFRNSVKIKGKVKSIPSYKTKSILVIFPDGFSIFITWIIIHQKNISVIE